MMLVKMGVRYRNYAAVAAAAAGCLTTLPFGPFRRAKAFVRRLGQPD